MNRELIARTSLARHGFHFTHSLGQNFMLEDHWIERVVNAAGVHEGQNILEIGPGAGLLTAEMASRGARVLAVELDRTLEPVLTDVLGGMENVEIVYQDILSCDIKALVERAFAGERFDVVANLPYYITADAIQFLLKSSVRPESISVMVQKEAAERILSVPGEKSYTALAATVRYFGEASVLLSVPPDAFTPPPHVQSCLLRIELHRQKPVVPIDEALFLRVIHSAFAMRRKTLANNLCASFGISRDDAIRLLERAELNLRVRGEALSLYELCRVADQLSTF